MIATDKIVYLPGGTDEIVVSIRILGDKRATFVGRLWYDKQQLHTWSKNNNKNRVWNNTKIASMELATRSGYV